MQNKFLFSLLSALAMAAPALANADTYGPVDVRNQVGGAELALLNIIFTGPIGFSLGLIVLVSGIITTFYNGDKRGIFVIVLGVLITLIPGVYNAANNLFVPMAAALFG